MLGERSKKLVRATKLKAARIKSVFEFIFFLRNNVGYF